MESSDTTLTARLVGIRPILFDRYGGDNKTKLDALDKVYLNERNQLCIPVLNVFSLLSAQNTPSVAKRFYGKQSRDVSLGIQGFVNIESCDEEDPMMAQIFDEHAKVYCKGDPRIRIVNHVARLKDGIPNPKERPMLPTGWSVTFRLSIQQNPLINEATVRKMVEQGGILGLGTFRPVFGRYRVEWS